MISTEVFNYFYPSDFVPVKRPPPGFNPSLYALDVLLPSSVASLGQEKAWQAHGAAALLTTVLAGAGWLLIPLLIAQVTGAFKRR